MKKIMFNDKYGLTEAVLDGRKTTTRRVIRIGGMIDNINTGWFLEGKDKGHLFVADGNIIVAKSRYAVGEVVAVAQSYMDVSYEVFLFSTKVRVRGKENRAGWANKMFVKADLMPHHIRITNIRAERLQDISDEDCLAEGISRVDFALNRGSYSFRFENEWYKQYHTPREAFAALINKVSGKGTWNRNPYVFVYEFERVD